MLHRALLAIPLVALAACAGRAPEVAVAPPALPPVIEVPVAPPLPAGASPGMAVPQRLADGSFPTPNRSLTSAATMWHLRAGLNVAALACRSHEATTVARYNALLGAHRTALTAAERTYAAEFRSGGGDWQDRYDDAMTRLYNYYATPPAQAAFCAAAAQVLADAAAVPADGLPAFATERLRQLDKPFTDFYAAFDAWRGGALPPVVIASIAPSAPPRILSAVQPRTTSIASAAPARLQLDLSSLPPDTNTAR